MDFVQAFDQMYRNILLSKLSKEVVHTTCIRVIQVMLMTVKVFITLGENYSGWVAEMNGGIQGAPITPELFLAYINDLPEALRFWRIAIGVTVVMLGSVAVPTFLTTQPSSANQRESYKNL